MIPKDRLYVTYFEGNDAQGVPADLEARDFSGATPLLRAVLAGRLQP